MVFQLKGIPIILYRFFNMATMTGLPSSSTFAVVTTMYATIMIAGLAMFSDPYFPPFINIFFLYNISVTREILCETYNYILYMCT